MRKVTLDKENMTITAQGGCLAMDLEKPADGANAWHVYSENSRLTLVTAEGLSVVFGAANDTGQCTQ
jgi:hypothetical protein